MGAGAISRSRRGEGEVIAAASRRSALELLTGRLQTETYVDLQEVARPERVREGPDQQLGRRLGDRQSEARTARTIRPRR